MTKKQNNTGDGGSQVVDLTELLSRPIENESSEPSFNIDLTEQLEETTFDEEPEPEHTEEHNHPEPVAGDYMPPFAIAETIVNLLDGLQSSVVPFLREKKIFTEKETEILQTIDRTGSTVYTPKSPENAVLIKWKKHEKILEKIPFNNGEKKRLVEATARYAETTQMKVSPLSGLMMAYSEVILKRSAYFFNE